MKMSKDQTVELLSGERREPVAGRKLGRAMVFRVGQLPKLWADQKEASNEANHEGR